MQTIRPMPFGATGAEVANLHKGLLFVFFHESGVSPETRRALRDRLAPDVLDGKFGEATAELIGIWQNQLKNWPNYFHPLPPDIATAVRNTFSPITGTGRGTGELNEVTAEALNWFIGKLRGH